MSGKFSFNYLFPPDPPELWNELLREQDLRIALTDCNRFDWKSYIASLNQEKQDLICGQDLDQIQRFCGELHRTATCPWTLRPAFHFVAYDFSGLRILISQAGNGQSTLLFEDPDGYFLSLQKRSALQTNRLWSISIVPREKDICEAFGSRCLGGRQLKVMLSDPSDNKTFKQVVLDFVRGQYAVKHGRSMYIDEMTSLLEAANHLVCFSGETFSWRLHDDQDESRWRNFLHDRQPQVLQMWREHSQAHLGKYVLHKRIHEAIRNFSKVGQSTGHQAEQAWRQCSAAIHRCNECSHKFGIFLDATTLHEARRQIERHVWEGSWQLKARDVYFTHDKITHDKITPMLNEWVDFGMLLAAKLASKSTRNRSKINLQANQQKG